MTSISLHAGDNRESLRRLIDQGVRVHSVVTDPPYGLVSVTKRFGKEGSAPAKHGTDGAFSRASAGFMGKAWDGTGIERDPEFWRLIHDILLPGGFVFAFSGSRTGHWQACAMEMAGFIMHPMHDWVFGSGFPKAHNTNLPGWEGWRHGTQSQKPALEPIYLGQRPYSEKTGAANLLKHGVGAFNIDGCRVPHVTVEGGNLALNPHLRESINGGNGGNIFPSEADRRVVTPNPDGRWPANLLHDGSPEVVALFPAQAGASAPVKGTEPSDAASGAVYGEYGRVPGAFHSDSGSAARFFNSFVPDADPIIYQGKASKKDRAGSKHPTVKPIALIQHLIRHVTPPGGLVLDPFAGSGTTAEAARREGFDCMLMEAEPEYLDFLRQRFDLEQPRAPLPADIMDLLGIPRPAYEDADLIG